jgi:pectinesterase
LKIALIGDSTVTGDGGWGKALARKFNSDVKVYNFAFNGRSSKSWYEEGHLPKVLSVKPDYILIQFGHNDQPGKGPERETDPETTFRDYLKVYIKEFRAIGSEPIILSSVTRRHFNASGKIESSLTPWAEAAQNTARELNVPFIDLHANSIQYHNQIGPVASMEFNLSEGDLTHLNQKGAEAIAELIICELKIAANDLYPHIKQPEI